MLHGGPVLALISINWAAASAIVHTPHVVVLDPKTEEDFELILKPILDLQELFAKGRTAIAACIHLSSSSTFTCFWSKAGRKLPLLIR